MFTRDWIEAHIPHKRQMCLLDQVVAWSADAVHCRTGSHRLADNPLRSNGQLSAVCAAEYGAQALAVHAALCNPSHTAPPAGYLVSLRGLELFTERLDLQSSDLEVHALKISASHEAAQYDIRLGVGELTLVRGRVMVKF